MAEKNQKTTVAPQKTTVSPKKTTVAPKKTTVAPKATVVAPKKTSAESTKTALAPVKANATVVHSRTKLSTITRIAKPVETIVTKFAVGSDITISNISFRVVKSLSSGAEADTYVVENNAGQFVLKLYNEGLGPNKSVLKDVMKLGKEGYAVDVKSSGSIKVDGINREYLLMDYCENGSVADYDWHDNLQGLLDIAEQTAFALDACHKSCILHKDIKPANLLVASNTEDLKVLLCDFGISDKLKDGLVVTEQSRTAIYAAPEVYSNAIVIDGRTHCELTPKADFFSLGMTLISLWVGEEYFKDLEKDLAFQKVKGKIVPPKDMPEILRKIVIGLTNPSIESRWGSQEITALLDTQRIRLIGRSIMAKTDESAVMHSLEDVADFCSSHACLSSESKQLIMSEQFYSWVQSQSDDIAKKIYGFYHEDGQKITSAITLPKYVNEHLYRLVVQTISPLSDLNLSNDIQGDRYAMTGESIGRWLNDAFNVYFAILKGNYTKTKWSVKENPLLTVAEPELMMLLVSSFDRKLSSHKGSYLLNYLETKGPRFASQIKWIKSCVGTTLKGAPAYNEATAIMRAIVGLGHTPEYFFPESGVTVKSLDDLKGIDSAIVYDHLINGGLQGWLAVQYYANPNVSDADYNKALNDYYDHIGQINSKDPDVVAREKAKRAAAAKRKKEEEQRKIAAEAKKAAEEAERRRIERAEKREKWIVRIVLSLLILFFVYIVGLGLFLRITSIPKGFYISNNAAGEYEGNVLCIQEDRNYSISALRFSSEGVKTGTVNRKFMGHYSYSRFAHAEEDMYYDSKEKCINLSNRKFYKADNVAYIGSFRDFSDRRFLVMGLNSKTESGGGYDVQVFDYMKGVKYLGAWNLLEGQIVQICYNGIVLYLRSGYDTIYPSRDCMNRFRSAYKETTCKSDEDVLKYIDPLPSTRKNYGYDFLMEFYSHTLSWWSKNGLNSNYFTSNCVKTLKKNQNDSSSAELPIWELFGCLDNHKGVNIDYDYEKRNWYVVHFNDSEDITLSIKLKEVNGAWKIDDYKLSGKKKAYRGALLLQNSQALSEDLTDTTFTVKGVQFKMVAVKGGTFQMGVTSEQDSDEFNDETPVPNVILSNYMIGQTEVTQELWQAVMGNNPSYFKGNQNPVEQVSWKDCQTFIQKLNDLAGQNFRLPTEAEWEYAARGGSKSQEYKYSGSNNIGDVAWYTDNSSGKTHPVAMKTPNELGLYDMSGNVREWCKDWYGSYSSGYQTNPQGARSGYDRVLRGGGWNSDGRLCRSSYRGSRHPAERFYDLGLRLVLSLP